MFHMIRPQLRLPMSLLDEKGNPSTVVPSPIGSLPQRLAEHIKIAVNFKKEAVNYLIHTLKEHNERELRNALSTVTPDIFLRLAAIDTNDTNLEQRLINCCRLPKASFAVAVGESKKESKTDTWKALLKAKRKAINSIKTELETLVNELVKLSKLENPKREIEVYMKFYQEEYAEIFNTLQSNATIPIVAKLVNFKSELKRDETPEAYFRKICGLPLVSTAVAEVPAAKRRRIADNTPATESKAKMPATKKPNVHGLIQRLGYFCPLDQSMQPEVISRQVNSFTPEQKLQLANRNGGNTTVYQYCRWISRAVSKAHHLYKKNHDEVLDPRQKNVQTRDKLRRIPYGSALSDLYDHIALRYVEEEFPLSKALAKLPKALADRLNIVESLKTHPSFFAEWITEDIKRRPCSDWFIIEETDKTVSIIPKSARTVKAMLKEKVSAAAPAHSAAPQRLFSRPSAAALQRLSSPPAAAARGPARPPGH